MLCDHHPQQMTNFADEALVGCPALESPVSKTSCTRIVALAARAATQSLSGIIGHGRYVLRLSGPELDQCDHDRDHRCPDRQVACGGRFRRGEGVESKCG
jgi:hypothetical protein